MKVIVTTCDRYLHLLPVYCYLFNKNWSAEQSVEIVGYKKPDFDLPSNFSFVSLGEQREGAHNFTTDLAPYFAEQPEWFIWSMEDEFVRRVDFKGLETAWSLIRLKGAVKVNLTCATRIQKHSVLGEAEGYTILEADQVSDYRLAMQPAIWKRDYLLKYMRPGLNPWQAETQKAHNDGGRIFGFEKEPVLHNEGTTKHDIYKLNLHKVSREQIEEMEQLGILNDTMTYERA